MQKATEQLKLFEAFGAIPMLADANGMINTLAITRAERVPDNEGGGVWLHLRGGEVYALGYAYADFLEIMGINPDELKTESGETIDQVRRKMWDAISNEAEVRSSLVSIQERMRDMLREEFDAEKQDAVDEACDELRKQLEAHHREQQKLDQENHKADVLRMSKELAEIAALGGFQIEAHPEELSRTSWVASTAAAIKREYQYATYLREFVLWLRSSTNTFDAAAETPLEECKNSVQKLMQKLKQESSERHLAEQRMARMKADVLEFLEEAQHIVDNPEDSGGDQLDALSSELGEHMSRFYERVRRVPSIEIFEEIDHDADALE